MSSLFIGLFFIGYSDFGEGVCRLVGLDTIGAFLRPRAEVALCEPHELVIATVLDVDGRVQVRGEHLERGFVG